MITKSECINFLQLQVEKASAGNLYIPESELYDANAVIQTIEESASGEEAYTNLGKVLTIADFSFKNISYREDCYDYLTCCGFDEAEAYELMEVIRKGKYRFERYQITTDKLPEEFFQWAKAVKYLPPRKIIYDIF